MHALASPGFRNAYFLPRKSRFAGADSSPSLLNQPPDRVTFSKPARPLQSPVVEVCEDLLSRGFDQLAQDNADVFVQAYEALPHATEKWDAEKVKNGIKSIVREGGSLFYIKDGEKVVATASLEKPPFFNSPAMIYNVGVLPAYQRQGLGRKVMEAAIDRARARKMNSIRLKSEDINISWYRKLGFHLFNHNFQTKQTELYYKNSDYQVS